MKASLTLIALALGYKVFLKASKEPKGGVRLLGIIIGTVVMVASAIGLVCVATKCMSGGYGCPIQKAHCPVPAPLADK